MNFQPEDVAGGILRDRAKVGGSLADVDPMSIDRSVRQSICVAYIINSCNFNV